MTYLSHMRFAASHGAACIWSGMMLLVHAVVPAWFQAAGSRLVRRLGESFDKGERDAKGNTHIQAA